MADKKRHSVDFGKNPLDFEHSCCFREQIEDIGKGTKNGNGEIVRVAMKSGKTGLFRLFSERVNYTFGDTGQRNWKYLFIGYELKDQRQKNG